jgi:hypothetical protein
MNTTTDQASTAQTSPSRSRRLLLAVPLAALALVGAGVGFAGLAHAGTMPGNGASIAMTIHNDTDQTMTLSGDYTDTGDFLAAPQQTLAPGATEIVTAASPGFNGMVATVNYSLPNATYVTFNANDNMGGANTDGTTVNGYNAHLFTTTSTIDTGFPTMNASYSIHPNQPLVY